MQPFRALSTVEQLARHLRSEILRGGLGETLPGIAQLVRELGVGTETAIAAVAMLEREGLVASQGARRPRSIRRTAKVSTAPGLNIEILLYEDSDARDEIMIDLRHQLHETGHSPNFSRRTLLELGMDPKRVAGFVHRTPADAWVVRAGSRPILEWFAARATPAFAMFGRQAEVDLASVATVKSPALAEALDKLVALGHRRIVMMVREERRKPHPGLPERRFLQKLQALGVAVGPYHLPDWENHPEGFHSRLESLFERTPPTVLIFDEPALFFATEHFLSRRRLAVPEDVSLLVLEDHPAFAWFRPPVSHLRTDSRQWVRRVVQWANNVARGRDDRRETLTHARFIAGGTIGPAPND